LSDPHRHHDPERRREEAPIDTDRIAQLLRPVVEAADLELYDVEDAGPTLRVLVDGEGGVGIDRLAELSRTVSMALDLDDPIPGHYTLEVSSPGLERRLRRREHFERAVGSPVSVRTTPGPEGRRRVQGTLVAVDGSGIRVDTDGSEVDLSFDEIDTARTIFEWGPAPKPGQRSSSRKGQRP
jgi:ribosome maturation factor RimP